MLCSDGMNHQPETEVMPRSIVPVLMQIGIRFAMWLQTPCHRPSKTNLLSHHISDDIEN